MTSIACIIDAYTELKSKLAALKLRRRPNCNYRAVGTYIAFLREEPECKSTYTHTRDLFFVKCIYNKLLLARVNASLKHTALIAKRLSDAQKITTSKPHSKPINLKRNASLKLT